MPQILKDRVRDRILDAAVEGFARDGYRKATMAGIARAAGFSAGNVYRYFPSKQDLFALVLPAEFAKRLQSLLRDRVRSLRGVDDVRRLEPTSLYVLASTELLDFSIENRLRVVILLGRSDGSPYAGFGETLTEELVDLAIAHFRALDPALRVSRDLRFNLRGIYRNFLAHLVDVLASFDDEARLRRVVADYTRYHLAGLRALFQSWPALDTPSQRSSP